MNIPLLLAQLTNSEQGWLTTRLLSVTLSSAEWVLWLLATLSILSIAVTLERALYFVSHSLGDAEGLAVKLAKGELDAVKAAVANKKGMEAEVVREALAAVSKGPDSVEEVIAATVARERPQYERFFSFLGTLGSNAPFVGLFGTVLGIIKAFHDLGASGAKGSAIQQTVMAGISEALVATAMGLFVAIPAVLAFNYFQRRIRTLLGSADALVHRILAETRPDITPHQATIPAAGDGAAAGDKQPQLQPGGVSP